MSNFKRDILMGVMFFSGILGFVSGEFLFSTIIFGVAAISTNISMTNRVE